MCQTSNPIASKLSSFKRLLLILIFTSIGFFLSVTQFLGISPDYSEYEYFLDLVRTQGLGVFGESRFEPGFVYFAYVLASIFTSNIIVYSLIVLASMFIKSRVFAKLSVGVWGFL